MNTGDRIFFAPPSHAPASGIDCFLGINEGETGYNETTVYDQDHADVLNKRQGITPAMVEAAVTCSMFNTWSQFDAMTERFEGLDAKAA
jgi:hypothetical protein